MSSISTFILLVTLENQYRGRPRLSSTGSLLSTDTLSGQIHFRIGTSDRSQPREDSRLVNLRRQRSALRPDIERPESGNR